MYEFESRWTRGMKSRWTDYLDEPTLPLLEVLVHNNFDQNPVSQKFVSNFDTENFSWWWNSSLPLFGPIIEIITVGKSHRAFQS